MAESLANLLNRSVTIEDASFRLLAHSVASPEDPVRQRTISQGRSPEEIIAYLTDQGLFDQIRKNARPQRVAPVPKLGMDKERIIAPILVGSHLYGYVWIISNGTPLEKLDFQAIQSATVVAALIISRQQAIYQAEQRLKDAFLNDLLDPEPYRDIGTVTDSLRRMGLHHGYQVLVLEDLSGELVNRDRLCALIDDTIRLEDITATVVDRGQRFIVLLGSVDSCQGMEVAERLVHAATQNGHRLFVGIGTPSREATNIRVCYQQAVEALQIGRTQSSGQPGIWAFEELGFLHWLHALSPNLQSSNRYYRIVTEIAAYDQKHNTVLLKTLEVFLDHLGNGQQTARALYVHRNTLNRHLEKIEETWKIDLKNLS